MIVGTGVDIVDVARVRRLLERWGGRALRRFLTLQERRYVARQARPAERVAARIAAKEAVFKAFGDSRGGRLTWKSIEVVRDRGGRPDIRLVGPARSLLSSARGGGRTLHVSMTHTHAYAVASATLVAGDGAGVTGRRVRRRSR